MVDTPLSPLAWHRAVFSEDCTLDAAEACVLLALVRHADNDLPFTWPSVGLLCRETRLGTTKVAQSLRELEARGCVIRPLVTDRAQLPELYVRIPAERRPTLYRVPPLPSPSALGGERRQAQPTKAGKCTPSPGDPPRQATPSPSPGDAHPPRHAGGTPSPGGDNLISLTAQQTTQVTDPARKAKKGSVKGARKRSQETPLPADWQPTPAHKAFAIKHGLDLEIEVTKFRGHAEANDRRAVVWNGAFSTWLGNAVGFSQQQRGARKVTVQRGVPNEEAARNWGKRSTLFDEIEEEAKCPF